MTHAAAHGSKAPLTTVGASALRGRVRVPGDKSISIRSLLFGALAIGETRVTGLLESEDALDTAKCLVAMGAQIEKVGDAWVVKGCGIGGFSQPAGDLWFGNSATGARLVMGAVAGNDIRARFTGDASLSRRPMGRVLGPLRAMGLVVEPEAANTFPLTLVGSSDLIPTEYRLPVASAQVKSAILIAGLHAAGDTSVIEPEATRDHTERMLTYMGAQLRIDMLDDGARRITVTGRQELRGGPITVPCDPSSSAFLAAAAAIVPGSDLVIEGVLFNPTRTGFYTTLQEMGADITIHNLREEGGEPIADIQVRYGPLKGVRVPAERAPSMIDEYPVLACVAAFATGDTVMDGLAELKVKESDRLAATAAGLDANGVGARVEGDTLIVHGNAGAVAGGGLVTTHFDHRIAMSFLVMGLASDRPVAVDDASPIATSFPIFRDLLTGLGADFHDGDAR